MHGQFILQAESFFFIIIILSRTSTEQVQLKIRTFILYMALSKLLNQDMAVNLQLSNMPAICLARLVGDLLWSHAMSARAMCVK